MLRAKVSYSSNGQHISRSDLKAHFTLDVYAEKDKPIGVMHVYPPAKGDKGSPKLFSSPWEKALQVSCPNDHLIDFANMENHTRQAALGKSSRRRDSICDTVNCRI